MDCRNDRFASAEDKWAADHRLPVVDLLATALGQAVEVRSARQQGRNLRIPPLRKVAVDEGQLQ